MNRFALCVALLTTGLLSSVALAQSAPPAQKPPAREMGHVYFRTAIGSFKILDGIGDVEFSFTGTVLISQLKGTVSTSGNVRVEHKDATRTVYFGTGSIKVSGEFRAIQWFGKNLSGSWRGNGVMRLFGEFDKNLNTGEYWYADRPNEVKPWYSGGMTIFVPELRVGATGTPVEKRPPPRSGG